MCKGCGLISSVCGVLLCHSIKLDYLLTIPIFFTVPLAKVPRLEAASTKTSKNNQTLVHVLPSASNSSSMMGR